MEFNFDEWADLYKSDPAAFEKKRTDVTAALINAAPPEHQGKMWKVQGACDTVRQLSTPTEALDHMMHGLKYLQFELCDAMTDLAVAATEFVAVAKSV